jgi:hypothetical protein
MKKAVSVERLLQWAYGVERVRGMPAWGDNPGGGVSGARGACHDDALTVDQVVGGLSDLGAAIVRDFAVSGSRPDWKPAPRYRMAPLAWQRSLRLAEWYDTHPASCGCRGYAHLCKRPGGPVPWMRGEPKAVYCPIVVKDAPHEVEAVRAGYLHWWSSLKVIRDVLRDGTVTLARHTVTSELPPQLPWAAKISVDATIAAE